MFIAKDVYDWKMLDEFGSVAFYIGDYINGRGACRKLVDENKFLESERDRISKNLMSYEQQVALAERKQMEYEMQRQQFMEEEKRIEKEQKKQQKIENAVKPKKSTKTQSPKSAKKKKK